MTDRLEDATLGVLELTEVNGYAVGKVDLGFPAVRAATAERVNANGTDDSTEFYGSRAVALEVAVFDVPGVTRRQALDRLRAYASPSRRPVLYYDEQSDGEARRVQLRGDQLGWPMERPGYARVSIAWVCPDGVIEAADASVVTATGSIPPEAGRSYPRSYPLAYPATSIVGAAAVDNTGTEPAAPVLQLWGPVTNPAVANLTTGEQIVFTDLALTAEQYVEIDIKEATVRLNGRADQSLYHRLVFADTTFWWLRPGLNYVRYAPETYSGSARAVITFRSAWL